MNVEFADSVKKDLKDLVNSFPSHFRKLEVHKQVGEFDRLNLRITDKQGFQCEIAFNNTILISEDTIEIIWCLTYAHIIFYELYCKAVQPDGQIVSLKEDAWKIPKLMILSSVDFLISKPNSNFQFNEEFPRSFYDNNEYGVIFKYAMLFFLSHELFHVKWNGKFTELMMEENNCDIDACKLILNSLDDTDYLYKSKGVCFGLMILNIYGIHANNFDGKTHPYTYDRLINNLELFFGQENDKIWGVCVAIFSLHLTEKKITQPKTEFDNFYDCVIAYKQILQN